MPTTFWICRQTIVQRQGRRFRWPSAQVLGDGFLISFPSTVAAVRAAAAIQRALHEYNADPQRTVEIRIGIHVGQVAERDGDLLGQAVHVAARVMAEAGSGQILTPTTSANTPSRRWTGPFSTRGCSGCGAFRSAGGFTRCPGTTLQRARPPAAVSCAAHAVRGA